MHTWRHAKSPLAHKRIFIPETLSKEHTLQSQETAKGFPISSSSKDGYQLDLRDEKEGGGRKI
jgi:hypothetical protein